MSFFSNDMGFPSSKQCHEELFLIFVSLIIYIAYITITFSTCARTHTHKHTHTLTAYSHICSTGKESNRRRYYYWYYYSSCVHNHLRVFLLRLSMYHCPSALLFIAKIFNEDRVGHSLVSLEKSGKTVHLPIPVLKIISTFNSIDVPDTWM